MRKSIKTAALLMLLALPAFATATVVKGDPDGGYTPCSCACTPPILGHVYCLCVCNG